MAHFSRKSRINIKLWKYISYISIFLIFTSSLILDNNFKIFNEDEANIEQSHILSSNSDFIWDRSWGDNGTEMGFAVWTNGTYVYTSGSTGSFGEGKDDLLLIKWDSDGNQIWNVTWGGIENDVCNAIWGNDTNIYTSGSTSSFTEGGDDLLIIKWDIDGNQIWNRTWGGILDDSSRSVWGDGNYIYTSGITQSFTAGGRDLLIIKWDSYGNQIWNRTWGGSNDDGSSKVKEKGGFLYTSGSTESFGEGGSDLLMVKWDLNGDQIWNQTWGDSKDQSSGALWCEDTYFYTAGTTGNFAEEESDFVLIKWDYEGNQIWNHTHDSSEGVFILSIWSDGTLLYIIGVSFSIEMNPFLIVCDSDGTILLEKNWSYGEISAGFSIWGDDSHFYICGVVSFGDENLNELLLIKGTHFSLSKPFLRYIRPDPDLDGNVTIFWDEVEGATSYNIYRDSSNIDYISSLVAIGSTTSLTYTDYGLSNGTYYYVIVATRDSMVSPISNCEAILVEISPETGDTEDGIPGYPIGLIIPILGILMASLYIRRYRELQ